MYTDIGVFAALLDSRSTITKSSITVENTRIALARMAGESSGSHTRYIVWNGLQPRSAAASEYELPMVARRACTMIAGQETFHVTRASVSARVPRLIPLNSEVNTKNIATPKISSGITNESSITKLNVAPVRVRQRWMPRANSTPSGTAISVV